MIEQTAQPQPMGPQHARALQFIIQAGKALLENGAEVFRVEQTMQHMAQALALPSFQVYVITNGIFVSAGGAQLAELRNVSRRDVHLGRLSAINAISRQLDAGQLTLAQAEQALAQAQAIPMPSCRARVLASAFGAFSFCFLFGGALTDALVSLCAGAVLGLYLNWCEHHRVENLFQRLTGAALTAVFCIMASFLLPMLGVHTSAAIIGAFMILTPGVAFTMAIRDFVHSDYLSGTIRLIDAVLVAASIAIGAGLILWVENMLRGGVL